jgi:hypothetical protein
MQHIWPIAPQSPVPPVSRVVLVSRRPLSDVLESPVGVPPPGLQAMSVSARAKKAKRRSSMV